MIAGGWYRRRRGVYAHLGHDEIGLAELGLHDLLCGKAQIFSGRQVPQGVWVGSERELAEETGETRRLVEASLQALEQAGLIRGISAQVFRPQPD